jgi:hypothetical protein
LKMLRIVTVLCSLFLCGCYGVGVTVSGPHEGEKIETFLTKKEQLISSRGAPSKIVTISDFEEDLYYDDGLGWSGIMPYVALGLPIPVPLFIPTHFKWTKYHIKGSRVETITAKGTRTSGCYVGWDSNVEGGGGRWEAVCDHGSW